MRTGLWMGFVSMLLLAAGVVGMLDLPALAASLQKPAATVATAPAPEPVEDAAPIPAAGEPIGGASDASDATASLPAPEETPPAEGSETPAPQESPDPADTAAAPAAPRPVQSDGTPPPQVDGVAAPATDSDDAEALAPPAAPASPMPRRSKRAPGKTAADNAVVAVPVTVALPARVRPSATTTGKATVEVEMLSEARITGERVLLSDVARIRARRGLQLPAANSIEVAHIKANATRSQLISRPVVRQALISEGVDMRDAVFTGASATRVMPVRNVVQSQDLLRAARAYLMAELTTTYGWKRHDIRLRPIQDVPAVVVPNGKVVIEPGRVDGRRPLGAVTINLDIHVDGATVKSVHAHFQVQVMGRVVVMRQLVESGNVIAPDDVELVPQDLTTVPEGALTKVTDAIGRMTQWTLRPGSTVVAGMAVVAPVVRKDSEVMVHFQGERVAMQLRGRALKDGQKGDTIPVRSVDTGKVIEAVVMDRFNVQVGAEPAVSIAAPPAPAPRPAISPGPAAAASRPAQGPAPQTIAAPGQTVILPHKPLPMVAPAVNLTGEAPPPRAAKNGAPLPPPIYVKAPATLNPYQHMQGAQRPAAAAESRMFNLHEQKILPLR